MMATVGPTYRSDNSGVINTARLYCNYLLLKCRHLRRELRDESVYDRFIYFRVHRIYL